jgi:hypothetical protein
MLWTIKAAENLIAGDFIEFITDRDGELSCKKASELASIMRSRREISQRAKCSASMGVQAGFTLLRL